LDTAWTPQSEPAQTKDAFEVSEEHLDFLSPVLRGLIEVFCGTLAGKFPDDFIFLAVDRARLCVRTAFGF